MRISEYPEYLLDYGFKKRFLNDRSGSWFEKKVRFKDVGYMIMVDLGTRIICVELHHKVKGGPLLMEDLKRWELNWKNLEKVLQEWDPEYCY